MRLIWIGPDFHLTTKKEINVIAYDLFLITAMRPIWILSNGLSIKNETLILNGS